MTRLCLVYADTPVEWNCSQWRITNPSYGLRRVGIDVDEVWIADWATSPHDPHNRKRIMDADAVLLQRNCFEGNLDALRYWRGLGKPVYIDLDDAYQMLPETVAARRFWIDNALKFKRPPLEQLREGLLLSSGVTSPSKLILQDWDAPKKVWLPNYVRGEWYANLERRPHVGIIIGWGMSMSHFDSFRYCGIVEALVQLCRRDPRVRVVVCGNDAQPYEMLSGIPPQQRTRNAGVNFDVWPQRLAQFDLGIAPLFGDYDRRRSWLKVVEYACAGVPCIVTKSDPYADLTDWTLAQVDAGADLWAAALDDAIANLRDHQERAAKR